MPSATQPFLHSCFWDFSAFLGFYIEYYKMYAILLLFALYTQYNIGDDRTRTDDFMRAKHAFYQLNYTPLFV